MFEKLGRLAEGLASHVGTSRRGFLGRVGKSALGVAAALGALAATAAAQSQDVVCCKYKCFGYGQPYRKHVCLPAGRGCVSFFWDQNHFECDLDQTSTAKDCSHC